MSLELHDNHLCIKHCLILLLGLKRQLGNPPWGHQHQGNSEGQEPGNKILEKMQFIHLQEIQFLWLRLPSIATSRLF